MPELPSLDEYADQLRAQAALSPAEKITADLRRQEELLEAQVQRRRERIDDKFVDLFRTPSARIDPNEQSRIAGAHPTHVTLDELRASFAAVSDPQRMRGYPHADGSDAAEFTWGAVGGTVTSDRTTPSYPPSPPPTPTRCKSRGHTLNTDVVTYRDGMIVGHCVLCDDRFEIPWWPGGTAAARAEGVLQDVMDERDGVDFAAELLTTAEQLEADLDALDDARSKIEIARQVIATRLARGDASPDT